MKKNLLLLASAALLSLPLSVTAYDPFLELLSSKGIFPYCPRPIIQPTPELVDMIHREAPNLRMTVINKVMTALSCANEYNVNHNNILSIIDYSLPANEKRLWIFDLQNKKLLFHTFVSHGIKSGALFTTMFSNKYNSKSSSLGVYKTEQTYYGRDGLSLRLNGLDYGFNDNAANRYIVMHGGWYVDEKFIKKYGRSGRSWGCPAVPLDLVSPIINTIKDNSLMVVYYPDEKWLEKSRFFKCDKPSSANSTQQPVSESAISDDVKRDDVLLTEINRHGKSEENTAVAVMSANQYEQAFNNKVPLNRMLRRQINEQEYVALSANELQRLITDKTLNPLIAEISFARPVIKMIRGYYETQMQLLNWGKVREITPSPSASENYTVTFDNKNTQSLKGTDRFIRWLGL